VWFTEKKSPLLSGGTPTKGSFYRIQDPQVLNRFNPLPPWGGLGGGGCWGGFLWGGGGVGGVGGSHHLGPDADC